MLGEVWSSTDHHEARGVAERTYFRGLHSLAAVQQTKE